MKQNDSQDKLVKIKYASDKQRSSKEVIKALDNIPDIKCELDLTQSRFLDYDYTPEELQGFFKLLEKKKVIHLNLGNLRKGTTADLHQPPKGYLEKLKGIYSSIPSSVQRLSLSIWTLGLDVKKDLNAVLQCIPDTVTFLEISLARFSIHDIEEIISQLPMNINTVDLGYVNDFSYENLDTLLKKTQKNILVHEIQLDREAIDDIEKSNNVLQTCYQHSKVVNIRIPKEQDPLDYALTIYSKFNDDACFKVNGTEFSFEKLSIISKVLDDFFKDYPDSQQYRSAILGWIDSDMRKIDRSGLLQDLKSYWGPRPVNSDSSDQKSNEATQHQFENFHINPPEDIRQDKEAILNAMDSSIESVSHYPWGRDEKISELQEIKNRFNNDSTNEILMAFLECAAKHRYTGFFHFKDSETSSLKVMRNELNKISQKDQKSSEEPSFYQRIVKWFNG